MVIIARSSSRHALSSVTRKWIIVGGGCSKTTNPSPFRYICSSQLTAELKKDKTAWENRPKKEDLVFGTTLSDHMLMVEWTEESGWAPPKIVPYQDLKISPAASSLHYGK
jgi:branched-chain amino acid aminotransferase